MCPYICLLADYPQHWRYQQPSGFYCFFCHLPLIHRLIGLRWVYLPRFSFKFLPFSLTLRTIAIRRCKPNMDRDYWTGPHGVLTQ